MAVGTGSIKRASNAVKEKEAKDSAKTAVEEVNSSTELDKKTDVKAVDEALAKKTPAKKTSTSKKSAASKSDNKKSVSASKKASVKKDNNSTEKESKKDKQYEIVEGITCNMPRYLL